jgi:hypothetical protein
MLKVIVVNTLRTVAQIPREVIEILKYDEMVGPKGSILIRILTQTI